jgi:hypothetical protein
MKVYTVTEYRREIWRMLGEYLHNWHRCPRARCRRTRQCIPEDPIHGGCLVPPPPPRLSDEEADAAQAQTYKVIKARAAAVVAREGEPGGREKGKRR